MIGGKFGMITVLERTSKYSGTHRLWLCSCECGSAAFATMSDLRCGRRRSCGCLKRTANTTNGAQVGGKRMPEYGIWASMKERCSNPKQSRYERYGGRGIRVCREWEDFARFIEDMGPRPSTKHTIERIDNDGDYEPSNCRWATWKEQANNRSSNVLLTIGAERLSLSQWAVRSGVDRMTIKERAKRHFQGDLAEAVRFYLQRASA